jgi:hypothetical protein
LKSGEFTTPRHAPPRPFAAFHGARTGAQRGAAIDQPPNSP